MYNIEILDIERIKEYAKQAYFGDLIICSSELDNCSLSQKLHFELNHSAFNLGFSLDMDKKYNWLKDEKIIFELINKLYYQSLEDNYFWQFCPFSIYEATFKQRLKEYLRYNPENNITEFCEDELLLVYGYFMDSDYVKIDEVGNYGMLEYENETMCFVSSSETHAYIKDLIGLQDEFPHLYKNIIKSQDKKRNFLTDKINEYSVQKKYDKNYPDFENYLTENAKSIIPNLIVQYQDKKPREYALMLIALNKLEMMKLELINQTHLHKALKSTFGSVGTRASLNNNLRKWNDTSNAGDIAEIKQHVKIIKELKK